MAADYVEKAYLLGLRTKDAIDMIGQENIRTATMLAVITERTLSQSFPGANLPSYAVSAMAAAVMLGAAIAGNGYGQTLESRVLGMPGK